MDGQPDLVVKGQAYIAPLKTGTGEGMLTIKEANSKLAKEAGGYLNAGETGQER